MEGGTTVGQRVLEWCRREDVEPLGPELVPGADAEERRRLAALGLLIGSFVPYGTRRQWPTPVADWSHVGRGVPKELRQDLKRSVERDPEVLAQLYSELVTGKHRRRLGTFFTPAAVVDFMVERVAEFGDPSVVIDPGAGVGAFTAAAARRWPAATVHAVDVNVVTLGLLGAVTSVLGLGNVVLAHRDFLPWVGEVSRFQEAGPRLFLGNPPYTRHQDLDSKMKESLRTAAHDLVKSKLAGLSTYFLAAALAALRPADSLCLVLPSMWTEVRYGRELREWLWRATDRRVELHAFPPALEVFPGTRVSATVLVVGPATSGPSSLTIHRTTVRSGKVRTSKGKVRARRDREPPRSLLAQERRATRAAATQPLGNIASVRRGVATGANAYFFLRDSEIDDFPAEAILPALRRMRHVQGDLLGRREHQRIGDAGHRRWLLSIQDEELRRHPAIRAYLQQGVAAGVPDRYLASHRERWYAVEAIPPPTLVISIMSKDRFRVVRNEIGAIPANSLYGITLGTMRLSKPLCDWLNSDAGQFAIRSVARHYSRGLLKIEPSDLRRVAVPLGL